MDYCLFFDFLSILFWVVLINNNNKYRYSAISIQGKRAYDYARQGIELPKPIEPRQVQILALELMEFHNNNQQALFRVECGGGTYMRSLVHDIGHALGSYAHMTGLKRTRQGTMMVEDSLDITSIDKEVVDLDQVINIINHNNKQSSAS